MNKAVFLDKDGTLIEDVPYNIDPDKIKLYPEVGKALKHLKKAGFKLVVISNQAGVAKGYFKEEDLEEVEKLLGKMLEQYNVVLDGFYYCPHHQEGLIARYAKDCACRKPKAGMILQAATDLEIDLTRSWMLGDILNDVEAGKRAGCKTILVDRGNETEWVINEMRKPDFTVKDLKEAAKEIIVLTKNDKEIVM